MDSCVFAVMTFAENGIALLELAIRQSREGRQRSVRPQQTSVHKNRRADRQGALQQIYGRRGGEGGRGGGGGGEGAEGLSIIRHKE